MIADDVAAAVVAALVAGSWGEAFMPEHVEFIDPIEPDDFNLHVRVFDSAVLTSWAARRVLREDPVVNIMIQQRVENDTSRVQQLKSLAERIRRHFAFADIGYSVLSANYAVHRDHDHLREKRAYTGVITLTYRTHVNA